jgi:dienelactone hydrolase
MNQKQLLIGLILFLPCCSGYAQTKPSQVTVVLQRRVQQPNVISDAVAYQLQEYLLKSVPALPHPTSPREWTEEVEHLRKQILRNVAFHGWPKAWVNSPPKFEDMGSVPGGNGYRMRKLRFEIVPGFDSTAILYEPLHVHGKAPAILNVSGHERLEKGKAAEYKQKRCINFAKRGIYALNPEWIGYGELEVPGDSHRLGPDLDLVGANVLGLFYLAMRRGLDYLASLPQVDPNRIGVTGISGGGWQTIVLSALDPRVHAMAEVAGMGSLQTNIAIPIDTYSDEMEAPDFADGRDYTFLVAMRAPRPTMLIHNSEDNCCFRADMVKPYLYDQIKPFFKLYGKQDALQWYENLDPGTHNYYLDNRQHAYAFFTKHFDMPIKEKEIPSWSEIKTYRQLEVGLPKNNLTILGLARQFASEFKRQPIPTDTAARKTWVATQREKLKSVVRYKPVTVKTALCMWNTRNKGLQSLSYRFDFSNRLLAAGIWLKAIAAPVDGPATIVLDDKGKKAAGDLVSDRVNRGEQVLAIDPIFTGETSPHVDRFPDSSPYVYLLSTVGDRALGLEVAQLLAVTKWLQRQSNHQKIRLETRGIRSEVIALVAAAINPAAYSEVVSFDGMQSLGHLLDVPVPYKTAPDLFCLDLYKDFDLDRLAAMAEPAKWVTYAEKPPA